MIPRKTPMPPRQTQMARQRIKPKKRKASEFARIYGSKKRVEWVKSLPCVVRWGCDGEIHNAHTVGGGVARKADAASIVPLCAWHHQRLHDGGVSWFSVHYSIDLSAAAARTEAAWRATQGGDRQ